MSQILFTKENLRKVEAWILTICFAIFLITLFSKSGGNQEYGYYRFEQYNIEYNFLENFFLPTVLIGSIIYTALMVAILLIEPFYHQTKSIFKTALCYIITFIILYFTVAICTTYTNAWVFGEREGKETLEVIYNRMFFKSFISVFIFSTLYFGYFFLKLLIGNLIEVNSYLNKSKKNKDSNALKYIVVIILWALIFFFFAVVGVVPRIITAIWAIVIPYSILIVALNLNWFIPSAKVKLYSHPSYYVKASVTILLLSILASLFLSAVQSFHTSTMFVTLIFILAWTFLILIPITWHVYNNSEEKLELETALGKSDASLSFLKSQINPHFLFNALNTLYGTALQEQAEKTGEGIQKLGDMMRFMLQENMQDKISLTRDIDYINNYIELQKLRTSKTANINIDTQILDQAPALLITPMVLIPFIENAFKHGISLNQPSHIKITLQTKGSTLYLDVQNSIHEIQYNDPEKGKSGIGLSNVKQRLALLYPEKHELIIRENAKEFFIHLTLDLN